MNVPVPEAQLAQVQFQDLMAALDELPREQREALALVSVDGFSYDEVSRLCGCAVGTVKSRVARARQAPKRRLGESHVAPSATDNEQGAGHSVG